MSVWVGKTDSEEDSKEKKRKRNDKRGETIKETMKDSSFFRSSLTQTNIDSDGRHAWCWVPLPKFSTNLTHI